MDRVSVTMATFTIAIFTLYPACTVQAQQADEITRVEAVRTFADTVLEHGRDVFGDTPTPLFADALSVETYEPLRWDQEGTTRIPSNLASQQILFRTLVGLTNLTGDARYRQAAEDSTRYHIDHLRADCGLFQWGVSRFYDLANREFTGTGSTAHVLKHSHPYYELMWEVDPVATERFIGAFWNAHVRDWSNLTTNRIGSYGRELGDLWESNFDDPEPWFETRGQLSFINAGTDLIYSAALLNRFTGAEEPLEWSRRLAKMYVKARHPVTGLGAYQYTKPARTQEPPEGPLTGTLTYSSYGDRAENQFGADFGEVAREGWLLSSPNSIYGNNAIVQLQLAEMLGDEGSEFLAWTVDGLKAWANHGYDPETNLARPMWADGTDLTDYEYPRTGYYGREGSVFRPTRAGSLLLWSYALGHRLSGDELLWETARGIAGGHDLGDLGSAPGQEVAVNLETRNSDPLALYGVLELCRTSEHPDYRELAIRIGDNIIAQRFRNGLFVPNLERVYADVGCVEPLALLTLEAFLRGEPDAVPRYSSGQVQANGAVSAAVRSLR